MRDVLAGLGLDAAGVLSEVSCGSPLDTFRKEHERSVADHRAFGVPTFVADDQAVFIRFMHRPRGDADVARRTIERAVDLVSGWPELNELKHTSIAR
jgi:hypothetical protein